MERNTIEYEHVIERGCGIDVHKETAVATVRGKGIKTETRTYETFTSSLKEMKDWLTSIGITHIAMESKGVYWQPVFNILEDANIKLSSVLSDMSGVVATKLIDGLVAGRKDF